MKRKRKRRRRGIYCKASRNGGGGGSKGSTKKNLTIMALQWEVGREASATKGERAHGPSWGR